MTDAPRERRGLANDDEPSVVIHMTCYPPSTNKLWARGPKGRRVRSWEYRDWLKDTGWEVKQQVIGHPPLACRFDVVIEVPISRRDTDNWAKPCLDLCEHVGVITNDGNARDVTVRPLKRDGIMVAFWVLPDTDGVRKARNTVPRVARVYKAPKKQSLAWKMPKGVV